MAQGKRSGLLSILRGERETEERRGETGYDTYCSFSPDSVSCWLMAARIEALLLALKGGKQSALVIKQPSKKQNSKSSLRNLEKMSSNVSKPPTIIMKTIPKQTFEALRDEKSRG